MTLRVTFDTNVLDLACRPERFPKDTRQPHLQKVRDALAAGRIQGFYSVTMLTIEGIMRKDRASVFAGTNLNLQPETVSVKRRGDLPQAIRAKVRSAEIETIEVTYVVEQPNRKPLHPEVIARIKAARALGVRVLKAVPRIGAYSINDPHNEFYLDEEEGGAPSSWIDRVHEVAQAIEDRGLGIAQVEALCRTLDWDEFCRSLVQCIGKCEGHPRGTRD